MPAPAATALGATEPPVERAEAEPPPADAPEPAAADAPLQFEDPYPAGAYPWPAAARDKKALAAELARWNTGGLGASKPWHPQPRVMISEPVLARGKLDAGAAMRALRAGRYTAVRRCYDQALQGEPELEGRTVLRLTVGRRGSVTRASVGGGGVPDHRKFPRAMGNGAVRSCLARAFQGAEAAPPKGADASILIAVDVWPGDAPLPVGSPGPLGGKLDARAARDHVEGKRAELVACFRAAEGRLEGVWGRLLVRVDIGADGKASAASEHESTFPDRAASRCVADALRQGAWPLPEGGEARIMVPLRWGEALPDPAAASLKK